MDALEAWGDFKFDRGPKTIKAYFQRSGIYIFLISFACVYYVSNAPLLLDHYDLGWHLAAGDLIRDRGNIPFQDPWSFTLGDRQWFNLSWLWDVTASILFQYTKFSGLILFVVACGAAIVGYQRWSHFLRQAVKVDSPIQRTNHHEDAATVFG